jgi:hypothetical protein
VSKIKGEEWRYAFVPQEVFDKSQYYDFSELLKHVPHS